MKNNYSNNNITAVGIAFIISTMLSIGARICAKVLASLIQ